MKIVECTWQPDAQQPPTPDPAIAPPALDNQAAEGSPDPPPPGRGEILIRPGAESRPVGDHQDQVAYVDDGVAVDVAGNSGTYELTAQSSAAGDECFSCIPIEQESTVLGSTVDNTGSLDDSSCAYADTIDAWYCFTASCSGLVRASTCAPGTNFGTTLAVFSACDGAELACNDDFDYICGLTSQVQWTATAGGSVEVRLFDDDGDLLAEESVPADDSGTFVGVEVPPSQFAGEPGVGVAGINVYDPGGGLEGVYELQSFAAGAMCPGDTNGDSVTDVQDLVTVVVGWGTCPGFGPCPGDVTGDGLVDVKDLVEVIVSWGSCG